MPRLGAPEFGAVLLRLDRPTDQLDQRLADRVQCDGGRRFPGRGAGVGCRWACDAGSPRPGRWVTRSCWPCWTVRATLEQAIVATAAATRRFVRRQRSWFRRDHRMIDLDASAPDLLERALAVLDAAAA